MKSKLYIIPGWEETCRRKVYKEIAIIAEKKGYEVVFKNVDWKKPLSPQVFPVAKDDIIFGFSLGAILAWLIAQNYTCKHLILASMTPHYNFTDKEIKKLLIEITGSRFVNDVNKNLKSKNKTKKQTILYGDLEGEKGNILVLNTDHEITKNYLKVINKIL